MGLARGRLFAGPLAAFPVRDGETFLLIGDSITACGRRGEFAPLGEGYVARFVEIATSYCPEPVHPNQRGHMIIALELWRVVCGEGSAVPSNSA